MNKCILILFCLCFSKSQLIHIDLQKSETSEKYFLVFDREPEIYYPRISKKTFTIDFYYTSILEECREKAENLKEGAVVQTEDHPFSVLTLKLPVQKGSDFETLPFKDLFIIQVRPKEYKKIWERRFPKGQHLSPIGPSKMSLYRAKSYEEFLFTFPAHPKNVLVYMNKKLFSVEIFGEGKPLVENKFKAESKFIKQISYSTLMTDSLSSEGVSLFDFKIRKKTYITYQFLDNILKIKIKKGVFWPPGKSGPSPSRTPLIFF